MKAQTLTISRPSKNNNSVKNQKEYMPFFSTSGFFNPGVVQKKETPFFCKPSDNSFFGASNNTSLTSQVQKQGIEEDETTQRKEVSKPKQVNLDQDQTKSKTKLPTPLKNGIENLSGLAMNDVDVHYNSNKPAQLQSLAYAQGTNIHLAPGQEKHLPHEAWHVVQQKQGRVKPTMQMKGKKHLNDDQKLEKEADEMGEKALKKNTPVQTYLQHIPIGTNTIQRFSNLKGEKAKTPAGAIKDELGISGKDINLPGNQPVGDLERAEQVEATITKDTLRKDDRKKDGNLSKVTSMARAEEFLLQGADIKKFYDAGHLIADQLLDGKKEYNSFEIWNLAPQVAEFNAPAYARTMEEPIKKMALAGEQIKVVVTVGYDVDNYKVPVEELIKLKVLTLDGLDIKKGKEIEDAIANREEIVIPRRIPNSWDMSAKIEEQKGKKSKPFPERDIPSGKGEAASKAVKDSSKKTPTIGDPYFFNISHSKNEDEKLTLGKANKRKLTAKQWAPNTEGVSELDIASLLSTTFPELGKTDEIAKKIKGGKKDEKASILGEAFIKLAQSLTEALKLVSGAPSTLELAKNNIGVKIINIQNQLSEIEKNIKLEEFDEAAKKIATAQSIVEDLTDAIEDAIEDARKKALEEKKPEKKSSEEKELRTQLGKNLKTLEEKLKESQESEKKLTDEKYRKAEQTGAFLAKNKMPVSPFADAIKASPNYKESILKGYKKAESEEKVKQQVGPISFPKFTPTKKSSSDKIPLITSILAPPSSSKDDAKKEEKKSKDAPSGIIKEYIDSKGSKVTHQLKSQDKIEGSFSTDDYINSNKTTYKIISIGNRKSSWTTILLKKVDV